MRGRRFHQRAPRPGPADPQGGHRSLPREPKDTTPTEREKVILVHLDFPGDGCWEPGAALEELARLAESAGAEVVATVNQQRRRPDAALFIGSGKAQELALLATDTEAGLIIFNHELSPAQQRNLEAATKVAVIDRSQLILDIFARRARTREGQLQVELAQLTYLLPRLAGMGKVLSRLGGGIGTRGPGETKLESDRRRIRRRIADLKAAIAEVRRHRVEQRKARTHSARPLIALVGYTNAGKTTLMNALCRSAAPDAKGLGHEGHDRLFDTLDPAVRRCSLGSGQEILLADTVGFVRGLPHHLIAAFRATLEEVVEADLLLHVVDSASPERTGQMAAVADVLRSLGVTETEVITVFNKVDLLSADERALLVGERPTAMVSARTGEGFLDLAVETAGLLAARRCLLEVEIPYAHGDLLSLVYERGEVLAERHGPGGVHIIAELDHAEARRLRHLLEER